MDYPLNYWAPVPLSQINMASVENLGQTSGDYPIYRQNLGWSAKSKIPDRLGFSRHMKTRLNCTVEDVGDGLSPKLLGSSSPITNKHGVCRESGADFWRLSDISAKSGMVGKK